MSSYGGPAAGNHAGATGLAMVRAVRSDHVTNTHPRAGPMLRPKAIW